MGMSLGSNQSVQTLRETDVWWHMHRLLYLQEWMERHRYHTHTSKNTRASLHFNFDCSQTDLEHTTPEKSSLQEELRLCNQKIENICGI